MRVRYLSSKIWKWLKAKEILGLGSAGGEKNEKEGLSRRRWYREQREKHGSPDPVGTGSDPPIKKKSCRASRGFREALLEKGRLRLPLEDDLGHELQVTRFAGTDGRSAVEVADGVSYEPE